MIINKASIDIISSHVNKFPNSILCGYEVIKIIINDKDISNYDIKMLLAGLYETYFSINPTNVLYILEEEGKKYFSDEIKIGNMNIYDVIFSENYFITLFDIWLLVEKYKIPIIILSQKILFNKKHVVTLYGEETNLFIFLITTPSRNDHVINFQILTSEEDNIKLPIDIISCPTKKREILFTVENKKTIKEYLDVYTPRNKTKYIKKITEKLDLLDDEEEEKIKLKPKARKPRTKKKKLGDDVIIVNEEELNIPKKPRKPRTKKKKLGDDVIIVNEEEF
jgi:hypothetical protein